MMKAHIVFGILLLVCAQSTLSASIVVKRGIEEEVDVPGLNKLRKELADEEKIANMHEMRWDSELAKKAEKECTPGSSGPNYMVTIGPMKKPSAKEIAEFQKLPQEQQAAVGAGMIGALLPFIAPTQYKVGCAKVSCGELTSICLVGPKSEMSQSDLKEGKPGSQCPNGKASSGLCNGPPAPSAYSESKHLQDNGASGSSESMHLEDKASSGPSESKNLQENASSAYFSILVLSLILSFL
ncbi:unnamed protein product [Caenorhabditis brenneri]